eukprot:scaffold265204_cov46-Attheya_sp.AAC.1
MSLNKGIPYSSIVLYNLRRTEQKHGGTGVVVYYRLSAFCAKIKLESKKCPVGQELFRAQYVVFRSMSLPGYFI